MSARIRYIETDVENVLISNRVFVSQSTGARYSVILDLNNFTFRIRNENSKTNTAIGGENINNLNVLKRTAKKHLERLGVNFSLESRMRTFGRCEKGYTQKKHTKLLSHVETE